MIINHSSWAKNHRRLRASPTRRPSQLHQLNMAALTSHPETWLKARAIAIAHDSASQPFRLGGTGDCFAGLAWVSRAALLCCRSAWRHCRTAEWTHLSGALAGTVGPVLPHAASYPASSPGLILYEGQGMCAKPLQARAWNWYNMGSFTSHWPKRVTGPVWSHEWKTDSTSWEEPQGRIIRGVDTEGRTVVAIFINVGPHPLIELLRLLMPHGDSLKSWTDVSPQAEIKPKHPDKHHLAGAMVCPLAPLPCQFWDILNIFSIRPSLIRGLPYAWKFPSSNVQFAEEESGC